MWDYYGQHKNFTWLSPPGISTAGDVHRWLHDIPEDPWIGKEHKIWNPDALQLSCFTHSKHKAFLYIAYGDTVTAVSPPVFIWANLMRLTGTWCILATTYNTQPGNSLIMVQIEHTGLVPIAALVKHSGDEPIIITPHDPRRVNRGRHHSLESAYAVRAATWCKHALQWQRNNHNSDNV